MKKAALFSVSILLAIASVHAAEAGWNTVDNISMEFNSNATVNYYLSTAENGGKWISNCSANPQYVWFTSTHTNAKELYAMALTAKASGARMKVIGDCQEGGYLRVTSYAWMQ